MKPETGIDESILKRYGFTKSLKLARYVSNEWRYRVYDDKTFKTLWEAEISNNVMKLWKGGTEDYLNKPFEFNLDSIENLDIIMKSLGF